MRFIPKAHLLTTNNVLVCGQEAAISVWKSVGGKLQVRARIQFPVPSLVNLHLQIYLHRLERTLGRKPAADLCLAWCYQTCLCLCLLTLKQALEVVRNQQKCPHFPPKPPDFASRMSILQLSMLQAQERTHTHIHTRFVFQVAIATLWRGVTTGCLGLVLCWF